VILNGLDIFLPDALYVNHLTWVQVTRLFSFLVTKSCSHDFSFFVPACTPGLKLGMLPFGNYSVFVQPTQLGHTVAKLHLLFYNNSINILVFL